MTEYRDAFRRYLQTGNDAELRAASENTGVAGGYLIPPGFLPDLLVQLKSYAVLLKDFKLLETSHGNPIQCPTRSLAAAGSQQTENTQVASVDALFGEGTLSAYMFSSGSQAVSLQLAQDSSPIPIESVITDFAGEVIGRELSALSVSGTGSAQPAGIITALGSGYNSGTVGGAIAATGGYLNLATSQAVTVNGTATTELAANVLSPQTLGAMMQAVDPAYWDGAKWYVNQKQFANLLQVTDSQGQPLIRANGPREMYGFPVVVANELGDLTASTAGGPIFGNLARAMYFRMAGFEVRRLKERYADLGELGFISYMRADFRSRDLWAAVTVKASTA